MGRRQPATLDRRRQAIPVRVGAGRLRSGLSVQSRRIAGPPRDAGWVGRVRAAGRGRAVEGGVFHGRHRRSAHAATPPGRPRREGTGTDFVRGGDARCRVRSVVHTLRRHVFAGWDCPGSDAAARQRRVATHRPRQREARGEGHRAGPHPARIHHHHHGGRGPAQRLDHQAKRVRCVPAVSAAHERVRWSGVPDGDRLVERPHLPVAPDARAGRLSRRERGQSRDRRARREVHEADLPPPRPLRVGRSDRRGTLVRRAKLRGPRPDRHLGLELRRLHGVARHVARRGRVQGRAGGGARDRLALLRHDLHRAVHAHPGREPGGLRRERRAYLCRQLEGQPAAGTRHRRRQRPFSKQRTAGRAARGRQQAVRHADLSQQDARDCGWGHAREPVRLVYGVAGGAPVGGFARLRPAALAVLTLVNLVNSLERRIVAALAQSLQHPEPPLSAAQAGSLLPGFLIVYMLAAPVFGSLGDTRSRPRLLGLGVAIWSVATALAGFARSFAALFLARAAVGIGEAAYGTISPALLADYYPRERRGRVLAVFFAAIPIGSALGYIVGGLADRYLGWRSAFFVAGIPGLVLAALVLRLYDPPRGAQDRDAPAQLARVAPAARAAYAVLLRNRPYVLTVLGYAAYTFAIGALAFWTPSFLERTRGIPKAHATVQFGAIVVATGFLGTYGGGWLG